VSATEPSELTCAPAEPAGPADAPAPPLERLPALDGLRGVAALVVLLHHVVRVFPTLGATVPLPSSLASHPWARLLAYTPLHLMWAGSEAVLVFFVLSGFVLAWPAANGRRTEWPRWYARRVVRLYLPVWGALALGAIVVVAVPHHLTAGSSEFLQGRPSIGLHGLLLDASLVTGAGANALSRGAGAITPVLWSLQWEVIFSLALPVYLFVARRTRRPLLVGAAVLVLVGARDGLWTRYLPMFLLGVLLAFHRPALRRWADRIDARPDRRRAWAVVAGGSVLLLLSQWCLLAASSAIPGSAMPDLLRLARVGALVGAVGFVVVALECAPARRLLSRPTCRWLGSRSFSLYLVHDPIVVGLAHLFGGRPQPAALFVPLAIGLSLAVAEGFHRLVERPSHLLAAAIG
jgi:peptidoglycan/LPS O-acetylase OafA/YrhL